MGCQGITSTVMTVRNSTEFHASTGNDLWEVSGISQASFYRYWFSPVMRPDASALGLVKHESPIPETEKLS